MKKLIPFIFVITACGEPSGYKVQEGGCDVGEESWCFTGECEGVQTCSKDKVWSECICDWESTGSGGREGKPSGSGGEDSGGKSSGGAGNDSGGSGGELISTGGSGSGGEDTGSTGGMSSGGSGTCVPKTCQDITIELDGDTSAEQGAIDTACGSFENGCGKMIDCSCEFAKEDCGNNIPEGHDSNLLSKSRGQEANLCGGGCYKITNSGLSDLHCQEKELWSCNAAYEEQKYVKENAYYIVNEITGKTCIPYSNFPGDNTTGFCCL